MRALTSLLLAMCMMCAAFPAFAEASQTQEVKIGNAAFQIPAGLEETRATENDGVYAAEGYCIHLVSWAVDVEAAEGFMKAMEKEGYKISFQQTAVIMGEMQGGSEARTAATLGIYAAPEDIGMLNGDPAMSAREAFVVDTAAFYAQTYRKNYFSVLVTGASLSPEETDRICKEIMLSVRIEGVTEEEMIADSLADYVIVTAASGTIRNEPSISGSFVKTAYKGEVYEMLEQRGVWFVVNVDGRTGYLHSGVAEIQ